MRLASLPRARVEVKLSGLKALLLKISGLDLYPHLPAECSWERQGKGITPSICQMEVISQRTEEVVMRLKSDSDQQAPVTSDAGSIHKHHPLSCGAG